MALFFDGLAEPQNPGVACYGFVVLDEGGEVIGEGKGLAGEPFRPGSTNNRAEYVGLIEGLKWVVLTCPEANLVVNGDSQLVIRQMRGEYAVRSPNLVSLHGEARALARRVGRVRFEWIPRKENELADARSVQAYEEYWRSQGRDPPPMRFRR